MPEARPKLSLALPPHIDVPEHARLAEELGYERCWLYDSPALYPDVWMTLARVAEATERMQIGPAVLVPSLRHVLTTAAAIGTLEEISPGRVCVAVGTGFTGRAMLGQKAVSWRATATWIRQLRGLLRGEATEVEGRRVKLLHPDGYGAATPMSTPIVVAANGPKGLAVARELGDGVMCVGQPQPGFDWCALLSFGTVLDTSESIDSAAVMDRIGPAIAVMYHGAYQASGEGVDALPGGKGWREEIEAFPEADRHLYVHEGHIVHLTDRDRRHISPALASTTLSGTPTQIGERLDALAAGGCTEVLYQPLGPDLPREIRAMAGAFGLMS